MNNTAGKNKIIFLILAVACFIGIILIFFLDGYLGLYDTLTMTTGEQTQIISPETWASQNANIYPPQFYGGSGGNITFSYVLDNRRPSSYRSDVSVSIWRNQEKVADVFSTTVDVNSFGKDTVVWNIDTQKLPTDNSTTNQFTLQIVRDDVVRKVILYSPAGIAIPKVALEAK
jgi:hypothetical protein